VLGSLAGGGCWAQLLYCVRLDVSPFVACLRPCFDHASQAKLLWRLLFAPWLSCAVQQFQCAAAHVSACSCGPVLGARPVCAHAQDRPETLCMHIAAVAVAASLKLLACTCVVALQLGHKRGLGMYCSAWILYCVRLARRGPSPHAPKHQIAFHSSLAAAICLGRCH
jgi:hypothetical protein